MEDEKIEIGFESVLCVRKNGELVHVIANNIEKRVQEFSTCTSMGGEEIKTLLESLSSKK